MIAGNGFATTNDIYFIKLNRDVYASSRYDKVDVTPSFEKSLTALSLEKLLREMFVPRKIQLSPIYNQKPRKTLIRNTLKQRIRANEKATL